MINNFNISDYDFSSKKVRYQGKVLTKYDLGQHLEKLRPKMAWFVSYDVFTYAELVEYLVKYLEN